MEKFKEMINSDTPVLVDFFATWCGPCQTMHPVIGELEAKVAGKARILTVDIDKNQALADQYKVRSVPTLIIFKNGEPVWRTSGVTPASVLEAELARYW